MKKLIILACTLIFAHSSFAAGSTKEAEKLLQLSGTKANMEQMTDMILNQQIQQNPTLAPFQSIMRTFLNKYVSYDAVKDELIGIYAQAFTTEELVELNRFYSSGVGKKAVRLIPELMQKGGEIGSRRVQENLAELQQLIEAEAKRLQEAQAN